MNFKTLEKYCDNIDITNKTEDWMNGFHFAVSSMLSKIADNEYFLSPKNLPDCIKNKRLDEFNSWFILYDDNRKEWLVCRGELNKYQEYISSNSEYIAKSQMYNIREEYCYKIIYSSLINDSNFL